MHALALAIGFAMIGMVMTTGDPAEELYGGYTVVSGEKYGAPEPKERIEGTTVRIAKEGIVVTARDKKDIYACSYKLESTKKPWRITMTSKLAPSEGEVAQGLIDKNGDTVRLIYALPGGETPTEFKTKDKQLMVVMKNMNTEKKAD